MARLLPPLLVLAVLVAVVWRWQSRPARALERVRILSAAQGGAPDRAAAALARYRETYRGIDDRWFSADAQLRLGHADGAIETIWGDPEIAARPDTQRRFAQMALGALGWRDRSRTTATAHAAPVLVALTEGGEEDATRRLGERARTDELLTATSYFFPAFRDAGPRPLAVLIDAFRERADERFQIAAALGALRNPDDPQRDADVERLLRILGSETWRLETTDVWRVACLALGQSGDPRALAALRKRLTDLADDRAARDRKHVRIGLFAAGDWTQQKELVPPLLEPDTFDADVATWTTQALLHLHRTGDPEARHYIGDVWEVPGKRHAFLRQQIARALLLQDEAPDESALPVNLILANLQAPGAPLLSRTLAQAYLLRQARPGAREALLETMTETAIRMREGGESPGLTEAVIAGLRALYLYAPSSN